MNDVAENLSAVGSPGAESSVHELQATLGLLSAVGSGEQMTQRSLAQRLGVALGLTNALVRRCINKGLIKVSEAPARRYIYYLTPHGFGEKSRLTAEFLRQSLGTFRRARAAYSAAFATCRSRGWTRIALCGTGELCEIASLAASDFDGIELVVVDRGYNGERFSRIPVRRSLAEAGPVDAAIVTSAQRPQEIFDEIAAQLAPERIMAPPFLNVSPGPVPADSQP